MAHIQEKWGAIRRDSGYWNPYSMTYHICYIFNSFFGLLFSLNKVLFVFSHYQWCALILMC